MATEEFEKKAEKVVLVETCARCRKQITPKERQGSLTSYLFAENRCKCEQAEPIFEGPRSGQADDAEEAVTGGSVQMKALSVPAHAPDLGERYAVIELIGVGGMGAVWKVHDNVIDKTLAVKVLRKELVDDASAVKRFEQEANAASRLTQSNLVSLYGTGQSADGSPFLIMDFIEGENIADLIRGGAEFTPAQVVDIAGQICEALQHAHEKGIVHRDLKPSNIILTRAEDGADVVKIVDFGIAKVLPSINEQTNNLTQTGDLFGSPLYMSPEQCKGETIDARSDIYSFGCVIYELLAGRAAFDADNPIKTILKHLTAPPEPIARSEVSQPLKDIVNRCLEKDPGARYQSIEALQQDLRALGQGRAPSTQLAGNGRRAGAVLVDSLILSTVFMALWIALMSLFESTFGASSMAQSAVKTFHEHLPAIYLGTFFFFACDIASLIPSTVIVFGFFGISLGAFSSAMHKAHDLGSASGADVVNSAAGIAIFFGVIGLVVAWIVGNWLYHAVMESSALQGTFGKALCRLRVVSDNGRPITFFQATIRHFSRLLIFFQLFLFSVIRVLPFPALKKYLPVAIKEKGSPFIHDQFARCKVKKR